MHMKSSAIPAQYARFVELIGMEGTLQLQGAACQFTN